MQEVDNLFYFMRKITPISESLQRFKRQKLQKRQSSESIYGDLKIDLSFSPLKGLHNLRGRYPQSVLQRNKISNRPFTTNRTFQFINRSSSYQKVNQQNKKDLLITTLRDYTPRHAETAIKGKIFKGNSWHEEKRKNSMNTTKTPILSQHSKIKNINEEVQQNNSHAQALRKNGYRNHLINLIGRNLEKVTPKPINDDGFFQYVMRFSYRSKKGYIPSNPGKINQDSVIVSPNLNNKTWQHFFGVCDGHGPLGHHVSAFLKNNLTNCIGNTKNLQKQTKNALEKGFRNAYQQLIKESKIDLSFSGSTINSVYMFQNKLYCCNVGDSRSLVAKQISQKKWKVEQLSFDHKPSVQSQANRIISMKGRVQSYRDENGNQLGPLRVWVKEDNIPGLAMTRSFGDLIASSVGVISTPQITQYSLSQDDKIILIGTDGVFQFISNEQLIDSITPYYKRKQIQQASDMLIHKTHKSWVDNSTIIDDISFVLIFLHYNDLN